MSRKFLVRLFAILAIIILVLISLAPVVSLIAPQPYVFPPEGEETVPSVSEEVTTVTE